jgi:transcription elongation factor Elf1
VIATESHRVSNWKQAVEEWNRRHSEDGWRSSYAPQLQCKHCSSRGLMLTTIYGATTATCGSCEARWEL